MFSSFLCANRKQKRTKKNNLSTYKFLAFHFWWCGALHAETFYFILDICVYRGNERESAIKISATSTSTPWKNTKNDKKEYPMSCDNGRDDIPAFAYCFYLLLSFCIWGRLLHFFSSFLFILASCFVWLHCLYSLIVWPGSRCRRIVVSLSPFYLHGGGKPMDEYCSCGWLVLVQCNDNINELFFHEFGLKR